MDTDTGETRPAARLIVVFGPSGAGRRRVVELVRARSPAVWLPVAATTRPRRDGEVDGVDYHFLDRATFQRMRGNGQLLEWAELAGRWYGTPRRPVETKLHAGVPVLLSTDPTGAEQVRRAMPSAQTVLLLPPDRAPVSQLTISDATIVADSLLRAADDLVGLLGSPALL